MAQRGVAAPAPASAAEIETTPEQFSDAAARLAQIVADQPAQPIEGARSRAVLAFADELVADPSLLGAWCEAFDGSDDITLVIYAPDWSAERAGETLGAVVAQAGLDGDDAADLLALATPATVALEASLARAARCSLPRPAPAVRRSAAWPPVRSALAQAARNA